jgi:S1-C subfamily serine protease
MRSLVETGRVARGYLGVSTESVTPELAEQLGVAKGTKGVVVTDVKPGSPADKAGLRRNDVILSLAGRPVGTLEDLRLLVAESLPNTVAAVRFVRAGATQSADVTLGTLTDETAQDELLPGVTVAKLTDDKRRELNLDDRVAGLLITNVSDGSPYLNWLAPGAVILEINRTPVTDSPAARQLLVPGPNLFLVCYRGVYRFLRIEVK